MRDLSSETDIDESGYPSYTLYKEARQCALQKLDRRERSSYEVLQYLKEMKFADEVAQQVVKDLCELNAINDERFARVLVRDQAYKGKGSQFIRQKLREKGIQLDPDQIREWVEESTQKTELTLAIEIVQRKYSKAVQAAASKTYLDCRKEKARAIRGLLRRGYTYSTACDALRAPIVDSDTTSIDLALE